MTDEELIAHLRLQGLDKDIAAADRIEQLVKERDDWIDTAFMYAQNSDFQRSKLAKAVQGLAFYAEKDDYEHQLIVRDCGCCSYTEDPIILDDKGNLARKVLDELEKTE